MPPFFCLLLSSCGCTSVCNFSEIWGIHFQNYFLYCLYFYFNLARYGIQIYKPWCSLFKNLIFALTCLADPSMAPELNTDDYTGSPPAPLMHWPWDWRVWDLALFPHSLLAGLMHFSPHCKPVYLLLAFKDNSKFLIHGRYSFLFFSTYLYI